MGAKPRCTSCSLRYPNENIENQSRCQHDNWLDGDAPCSPHLCRHRCQSPMYSDLLRRRLGSPSLPFVLLYNEPWGRGEGNLRKLSFLCFQENPSRSTPPEKTQEPLNWPPYSKSGRQAGNLSPFYKVLSVDFLS